MDDEHNNRSEGSSPPYHQSSPLIQPSNALFVPTRDEYQLISPEELADNAHQSNPGSSSASENESLSETEGEEDKEEDKDFFEDEAIRNKIHRTPSNSSSTRRVHDSENTLVEAALTQAEAKDRHVRFHDHVAESAALVHRMLSMRDTPSSPTSPVNSFIRQIQESNDEYELGPLGRTIPGSPSGGSVLASLMKLESQRRIDRPSRRRKSSRHKKPASFFNLPRSNADLKLSDDKKGVVDSETTRKRRTSKIRRPTSWLSTMASGQHLVPSLEKRKKQAAPSVSRRSSLDSVFTTASQFEPITLEDRIRITFEIANILQKQEFLCKLAKSLMLYGCPAHRLEYAMRQVSTTLGVDAEYIYMPNVMFLSFYDRTTHTTETHFIRQPQTFEMHRLSEIYRLEKLVSHGEVSVDEALEFIEQVFSQPPIYPVWMNPFVYALASFAGSIMFFGARWKEGGVSAALAMVFAVYEVLSGRIANFQPIWEITVCILIGFVARGIEKYGFCFAPIAFSSFIVILPGYPMAVAIFELVSRQLVSGVVRMVYAIIYSFLLGYGVSMGSELYRTIDKSSPADQSSECKHASSASTCVSSESQWFNFLLVPLFSLAFCVFVRARPPRWPIMITVAVCAYVINYSLACWAGAPPQVLQVVPAFGLGMLGNLLTKFTGQMSFDAVLLGIFYLVPSSLGLKAALGLFGESSEFGTQGAEFALAMIESSIGITIGLFLATLIVYPKGTQHTPLMNF